MMCNQNIFVIFVNKIERYFYFENIWISVSVLRIFEFTSDERLREYMNGSYGLFVNKLQMEI